MTQSSASKDAGKIGYALKEALIAGVFAFGLFVLYVGIETYQNINNQLVWRTRWGLLATFVIIAAVSRFLVVGYIKPHLDRRKLAKAKSGVLEISEEKGFFHKNFLKIALLVLVAYPVAAVMLAGTQGSLKYVDNFGIQILIYVIL